MVVMMAVSLVGNLVEWSVVVWAEKKAEKLADH